MNTFPRCALAPSRFRVDEIDAAPRRRLDDSLSYAVSEFVPARGGADRDELSARLVAARLSPWVFSLYSKFVAEISNGRHDDVAGVFDDIVLAASLPAEEGVVGRGDPRISPGWWDHFQRLHDITTGRRIRALKPRPRRVSDPQVQKRETRRIMQKTDKIDYTKLLGFASVSDRISGSIDFQDATFGAKLGAKVGPEAKPAALAGIGAKAS